MTTQCAPGVSVVIPAWNEAEHIARTVAALREALGPHTAACEFVLVDDGSDDGTPEIMAGLARVHSDVRCFRHARNLGKGRALRTGCAHARHPLVVLIDADLQIGASQVLPLVMRLRCTNVDVAVGSKYHPAAKHDAPWHRRLLSRAYHVLTALLFRLPLRDTQTGLKVLRREVAGRIVPTLRSRRFAWDVELLLAATRLGYAVVVGPVDVRRGTRPSRVSAQAALRAGWDTLCIAWRDCALAHGVRRPRRRRRRTKMWVCADDAGLSASTNTAVAEGLASGALTTTSLLVDGGAAEDAVRRLRGRESAVGLHLDLLAGRSLRHFVLDVLRGREGAHEVRARAAEQLARARACGLQPRHLDAHCHAYLLPHHRRAVAQAAAQGGVCALRTLRARAGFGGHPWVDAGKRAILTVADVFSRGVAHRAGLVEADAFVDAQTAAAWVARGALPDWVRGRRVEVVGHPTHLPFDGPAHENRAVDREAETRALCDPPLAQALAALGAEVIAP